MPKRLAPSSSSLSQRQRQRRRYCNATMRLDGIFAAKLNTKSSNSSSSTSRTIFRRPLPPPPPPKPPLLVPPVAVGPAVNAASWGQRRRRRCRRPSATTADGDQQHPLWTPQDFVVGGQQSKLGEGHFGRIVRACNQRTGEAVALKCFPKENKHRGGAVLDLTLLRREINIQSHLSHPHILPLHGYYESDAHVHLVLEYAPYSDLLNYQQEHGFFHEHDATIRAPASNRQQRRRTQFAQTVLSQLAQALQYLETVQVAHRDLKPENTVVVAAAAEDASSLTVKLADFGWATWWRPHQRHATLCGTAEFCPPEMLLPQNKISYAAEYVDRWMLGVLAVELVEAQTPFHTNTKKKEAIFDKIRNFKGFAAAAANNNKKNTENQSPDYVDFVERLLPHEPTERMSAQEALEHRFLRPSKANGRDDSASALANSSTIVPVSPTVAQRRQLFQSAMRNRAADNL